jgi:hypothetical protein
MPRTCAQCGFLGERELVCPRCRLPLREVAAVDAGAPGGFARASAYPMAAPTARPGPGAAVGAPDAWSHPTHRAAELAERGGAIGLWLDYTLPSLVALDAHLDVIWPEPEPTEALDGAEGDAAHGLGAYLGELLCHELGARWLPSVTSARGDGGAPAVQLPSGARVLPFDRARERLLRGPSQPLGPFARALFDGEPGARDERRKARSGGDAEHWAAHAARANAEHAPEAARTLALRASELDPSSVSAALELAAACVEAGRFEDARAALDRAAQLPDVGARIHRVREIRGRLQAREHERARRADALDARPSAPPEPRISAASPIAAAPAPSPLGFPLAIPLELAPTLAPSAPPLAPPSSSAPPSEIESPIAAAEVLAARRHLDFSIRSLADVDAALVELGRSGPLAPRQAWAFGCYLGEVIRRALGGEWQRDLASPLQSGVALPSGAGFCPFVWVQKRAEGGESIPARFGKLRAMR